MRKGSPKVPIRDLITQTLTPQRLSVSGWALAAILFGTVGLAAINMDARTPGFDHRFAAPGLPLPPAGPVTTTASIGGQPYQIEVLSPPDTRSGSDLAGHVETLRQEIVALRRRLEAIANQNEGYSARLSALEAGMEEPLSSITGSPTVQAGQAPGPVAPVPLATGKMEGEIQGSPLPPDTTGPHPQAASPFPLPKPKRGTAIAMTDTAVDAATNARPEPADDIPATNPQLSEAPAPDAANVPETIPRTGPPPRLIEGPLPGFPMPERDLPAPIGPRLADTADSPVKIIELPTDTSAPVTTGSIDPAEQTRVPAAPATVSGPGIEEAAAPEEPVSLLPPVVRASDGVGRLKSAAASSLARSDFGAVIGRYASQEDAIMAWIDFADQNSERMSGLRPMLAPSTISDTGFELLVGPFGNAADAAVACLQLLDVAQTCYPTLFAGKPLPARENAQNTVRRP
ncbi:hypothetical protein GCM10011316_37640 [Roseibium aquae]|uniref:SPOR domain-containing protein n=1 Tax=Roseibium aquae TaxID=1323746 RepID=A0A916X3B6_9HYPH|nr:hypothetical protein [Roseibium aquae]GGB62153.1 hypothetical protein GCM10011316_37640 [Roseibium aquae]